MGCEWYGGPLSRSKTTGGRIRSRGCWQRAYGRNRKSRGSFKGSAASGRGPGNPNEVWADGSKRVKGDITRITFEGIYVDLDIRREFCAKPYAPSMTLFRMDGLDRRMAVSTKRDQEA